MKPTRKAPEIERLMPNRRPAILANRCVPKPIGCGELIGLFRDPQSEKEYTISGLCQKCQDSFFGKGD